MSEDTFIPEGEAPVNELTIDQEMLGEFGEKLDQFTDLLSAVNGEIEEKATVEDVAVRLYMASVGGKSGTIKRSARMAMHEGEFYKDQLFRFSKIQFNTNKDLTHDEKKGFLRLANHLKEGVFEGDLVSYFPTLDLSNGGKGFDYKSAEKLLRAMGVYENSVMLEPHEPALDCLQMHILAVAKDPWVQLQSVMGDFTKKIAQMNLSGISRLVGLSHLAAGRSRKLLERGLRQLPDLEGASFGDVVIREFDPNEEKSFRSKWFGVSGSGDQVDKDCTEIAVVTSVRNAPLSKSTFVEFVTKGVLPKVGEVEIPIIRKS